MTRVCHFIKNMTAIEAWFISQHYILKGKE